MELSNFIVEEGILGITLGTIIAFAVTNYMKSFRKNVFSPLLFQTFKVLRVKSYFGEFLSSTLEFLLLLLVVYIVYTYIVYPIFHKEIQQEKEKREEEEKWKKNVLQEVQSIDTKIMNVNYGL